jgi:signal transduction histidine kinase
MSHEIRTPMNAVIGLTELVAGDRVDERAARVPEDGQGFVESLLALINDILDFSKIEAGKLELDPIAVSTSQRVRRHAEGAGGARAGQAPGSGVPRRARKCRTGWWETFIGCGRS